MKADPINYFLKSLPKLSKSLVGQHTLLVGEAGTGKTLFTSFFLAQLLELKTYSPQSITILDFGPPKIYMNNKWIGGRIENYISLLSTDFKNIVPLVHQVKTLPDKGIQKIRTPRLTSHSTKEILQFCLENYQTTNQALQYYQNHPTPVLIINDVTIYLHLGGIHPLLTAIKRSETALINGYAGKILMKDHGSGISLREKSIVRLLARHCQYIQTDNIWTNAMEKFFHRIASK